MRTKKKDREWLQKRDTRQDEWMSIDSFKTFFSLVTATLYNSFIYTEGTNAVRPGWTRITISGQEPLESNEKHCSLYMYSEVIDLSGLLCVF